MMEISLNMYHAVALGAVLFWIGGVITDKVSVLNRYCIPAPLVGGLLFSIINLQTVFQNLFFTTVGFTVSIPALLRGGKSVVLVLILSIIMIPIQNALGGGIMLAFGQDPLIGIGIGSTALIGGPATAAAYGPELVKAGAPAGADVAALAAATFGLVSGSLMGGPVARSLIVKHNLRSTEGHAAAAKSAETLAADVAGEDESFTSASPRFVKGFMLLLAALGIGAQISVWLTDLTGLTFPSYIGAMLTAVVIRNVMIAVKVEYPDQEIDTMGTMFLSIFLALALSSLKLWELVDLALPMIICLLLQCVVSVQRHGPRLRGRRHVRRLHRLRHGRDFQRHGQHAGGHQEVWPRSGRLLRHPHGWRYVHRLLQCGAHHLQHQSVCGYVPLIQIPCLQNPVPRKRGGIFLCRKLWPAWRAAHDGARTSPLEERRGQAANVRQRRPKGAGKCGPLRKGAGARNGLWNRRFQRPFHICGRRFPPGTRGDGRIRTGWPRPL